jgi:hypothetical protein
MTSTNASVLVDAQEDTGASDADVVLTDHGSTLTSLIEDSKSRLGVDTRRARFGWAEYKRGEILADVRNS